MKLSCGRPLPQYDRESQEGGVRYSDATIDFIHQFDLAGAPSGLVRHAKRSLLDLIGVWASGMATDLSSIIRDHAADHFAAGSARSTIMFDGRVVSPAGAALAGGMTIDAIDAHDGYRPSKGHIGCGLLPALLAVLEAEERDGGGELLDGLVVGYEFGARAATAQHATAADYHSSGSWGAVACAAVTARVMGLTLEQTRHALGIAEYHGPRAPMMRLIDHPSMLKDSSGWGAMAGLSAAYLACGGFTGAPAAIVESETASKYWLSLGREWAITKQYFKPWPVCRWAQPPMEAILALRGKHGFRSDDIQSIEIRTFHQAIRLAGEEPRNTEEAQYSIAFPVACAAIHGTVGLKHISGDGLMNGAVLDLASRIRFVEDAECQSRFPEERLAAVAVELRNGDVIESANTAASGDPESPLTDDDLADKFDRFASSTLDPATTHELKDAIGAFDDPAIEVARLYAAMKKPVFSGRSGSN